MHPEVKEGEGGEGSGVLACGGDLHLSAVVWSQTPTWASKGDGRRGEDTFPQGYFIQGSFSMHGGRKVTSGKLSLQVPL